MPSKSAAQHRLMAAAANNPAFAKKVGIPQSVGAEFMKADKGKRFSTTAKVNRPNTAHGKMDMPYHSVQSKAKGGEMKESKAMMKKEVSFMKKKGAPKSMLKHEMAEAGMKKGGGVKSAKYMSFTETGKPAGMKNVTKMAKGGSASARADGIAQRGKTKGKMMRKGGKVC